MLMDVDHDIVVVKDSRFCHFRKNVDYKHKKRENIETYHLKIKILRDV